jgi:hypothetical protein
LTRGSCAGLIDRTKRDQANPGVAFALVPRGALPVTRRARLCSECSQSNARDARGMIVSNWLLSRRLRFILEWATRAICCRLRWDWARDAG